MTSAINLQDPNFAEELALLGATGALHYGPLGTEIPDLPDADETGLPAIAPPNVNMGWINDAGITESLTQEKANFIPFQINSSIRDQVTSEEFTFAATVWSIGGLANSLYYNVAAEDMQYHEASGVTMFDQGGSELPEDLRFVLTVTALDGEKERRFYLPAASVQERGSIVYTKTDLVGYEFTFKANFDSANGYSVRRMFREGWRPGYAGSTLTGGARKDFGDWSGTLPVEPPVGG